LSYGKLLANAVSVVILALGVIAALDQLEIAQNVVNAVLYASLAAVVGVVVVAVGGGGIAPMRQRWEQTLARVEAEAPRAAAEARGPDPVQAVHTEAAQYSGNGANTQQLPPRPGGASSY
jgi:hypothetical protein